MKQFVSYVALLIVASTISPNAESRELGSTLVNESDTYQGLNGFKAEDASKLNEPKVKVVEENEPPISESQPQPADDAVMPNHLAIIELVDQSQRCIKKFYVPIVQGLSLLGTNRNRIIGNITSFKVIVEETLPHEKIRELLCRDFNTKEGIKIYISETNQKRLSLPQMPDPDISFEKSNNPLFVSKPDVNFQQNEPPVVLQRHEFMTSDWFTYKRDDLEAVAKNQDVEIDIGEDGFPYLIKTFLIPGVKIGSDQSCCIKVNCGDNESTIVSYLTSWAAVKDEIKLQQANIYKYNPENRMASTELVATVIIEDVSPTGCVANIPDQE